ncbi:MAG: dihydrofolate reductase family protein [Bacteroidota bacterium]|nr:dihydrofolate reductase family protein [Bacteroidota bacterium]
MNCERKVILYIAMSLDGYIATQDNGLDFLSRVEEEGQDYSYSDFVNTVDTVIVGRKSYEKVLSMGLEYPHLDKDLYIITRTPRSAVGSAKYYTGNLKELVLGLKSQQGKSIYVDGGAEIVNEMLMESLIDELYISIIPVLLGDGISLFHGNRPEMVLKLVSAKTYNKGLVQLHYVKA